MRGHLYWGFGIGASGSFAPETSIQNRLHLLLLIPVRFQSIQVPVHLLATLRQILKIGDTQVSQLFTILIRVIVTVLLGLLEESDASVYNLTCLTVYKIEVDIFIILHGSSSNLGEVPDRIRLFSGAVAGQPERRELRVEESEDIWPVLLHK